MSVRTDVLNLNVNINGNKAQNDLNNLRKKAADIKDEMAGLKRGTQAYIEKATELKRVNADMDALKKTIGLAALSQKELIKELNTLKALRGSVVPFSKEYKDLSKSINEVEKRLFDVKNGTQGFASVMAKLKTEVKQFGILAISYLGFEFLTNSVGNLIRGGAKVSDQLSDLQRVSGLTAKEAKALNKELGALDTRTSTEGLRSIAIVAGKLGVAKNDIGAFTKEVDKLVVALGDELGDADQITSQLGKILNVFDGKISGDNISKLGNAIVELANNGVATGGFISDFTQRVAGIAKASNLSLGSTVGLAAGFEELGLRSESSSTALQKLLTNIANDLPAAAKIAGKDVKEFGNLFAAKPQEALILYAQGLTKNKQSFSEIAASFKDAGEEGARVVQTLQAIGQSGDFLKQKIDLGNESIKNATAINEAFALKNENFAASVDKLAKDFNKFAQSTGVQTVVQGIVNALIGLVNILKAIPGPILSLIIVLASVTLGYSLWNTQLVINARASLISSAATVRDTIVKIANRVATLAVAAATGLATSAQAAYITVTTALAGRITAATAAQRLWSIALSTGLGPIGILIGVVGGLAGAMLYLSQNTKAANLEQKYLAEIANEVNEKTAAQSEQITKLSSIALNQAFTDKKRLAAMEDLIKIDPSFRLALVNQKIDTEQLTQAVTNYITKIRLQATTQAAIAKTQEKSKAFGNIALEKDELETTISLYKTYIEQGKKSNEAFQLATKGLSDNARKYLESNEAVYNAYSDREEGQLDIALTNLTKHYTEKEKELQNSINKELKFKDEQTEGEKKIYDEQDAQFKERLKNLKKGTEEYKLVYADYQRFVNTNKPTTTVTDNTNGNTGGSSKADSSAAQNAAKQRAEEAKRKREQFEKEATDFKNDIEKLRREVALGGKTADEQEIQRIKDKYADLIARAVKYHVSTIQLEELQSIEIQRIIDETNKKRFDERSIKEYEDSLTVNTDYYNNLRLEEARYYADRKINKQEYENQLKKYELDEKNNRVIIANDYANTVKKAATDVKEFRKDVEKAITENLVTETEKRVELTEREALAAAKNKVLTSRGDAKIAAQKAELQLQFLLESQYLDKKSELYKLKETELQQSLKDIEKQAQLDKIDKAFEYVGYVQEALSSISTIANNIENAQLAKDKKRNDDKKSNYKNQLDNRLISQEQYDKKVTALNEEQDKKEREIRRKQAAREKALNIFNAIINSASAVVKTMASVPFPLNIPLAIAQGVLGGIQVAAIASTPLPELAKGDWIRTGNKHSEGGINVEIERDEAVMSANAMTDTNRYNVTGTPAQITSALNSRNGGTNWANGAVINLANWLTKRPTPINNEMPSILANGGFNSSNSVLQAAEDNNSVLLATMVKEMGAMRNDLQNFNARLHAVVSIKEFKKTNNDYETARAQSGL